MGRRVFFIFYFADDVERAWKVRNRWVEQTGGDPTGVITMNEYDVIEEKGEQALDDVCEDLFDYMKKHVRDELGERIERAIRKNAGKYHG